MFMQIRYLVDGVWRYVDDLTALHDDDGHVVNILEVCEYVPENLESLVGFEAPASPPSRYAASTMQRTTCMHTANIAALQTHDCCIPHDGMHVGYIPMMLACLQSGTCKHADQLL